VALLLHRRGLERVRPLAGGLDAWRALGFPLEAEAGPAPLSIAPPPPLPEPALEALGDVLVTDSAGGRVPLADLWRERPAVLVFIRHFGCLLCRELVVDLREHAPRIDAAGATLAAIGNGTPQAAARFRADLRLDFPVLVDERRDAYALLGFRRDIGGSARPAVLRAVVRAWRRGARPGPVEGDPWQLGGLVVVRPGGEIAHRFASRHAGDHPPLGPVLAALRAVA